MPQRWTTSVTIANNASLSSGATFGGGATYIGLIMPATWTTAALTFKASTTVGGTYYSVYKEDVTELSVTTPVAGTVCSLDAALPYLSMFPYIQVRSGTASTPVNQLGDRTLTFLFER